MEENNEQTNRDIVQTSVPSSLASVNLFDEKQLAAAENFITKVMRSEKGGIKSVNDGLAVLMRAQDLGLPFSTCIEHIHVINGKTGIDIHIIKALMSKAACTWELTKDYQALYEYTDGINTYNDGALPSYAKRCNSKSEAAEKAKSDTNGEYVYVYPVKYYKDAQGNVYKDYQLNDKFIVAHNKAEANEAMKNNKIPIYRISAKPIDFVTEYKITRNVRGKVMTSIGHFSYSEALTAGMFEKDTYKKYARILIGHRAFTLAARDIASDILFGCMETTELKIVTDSNISEAEFMDAEVVE